VNTQTNQPTTACDKCYEKDKTGTVIENLKSIIVTSNQDL
jgi:hypothetical protein